MEATRRREERIKVEKDVDSELKVFAKRSVRYSSFRFANPTSRHVLLVVARQ